MANENFEFNDFDRAKIEQDARALRAQFIADGVKAMYRYITSALRRNPQTRSA